MGHDEVDEQAVARGRLIEVVSKRGYKRVVAVALALAGCLPAGALAVSRPPGFDSTPLIGLLFVVVPALVLLVWVRRDPEAKDARELVMWLRTTTRSEIDLPPQANQAVEDLLSGEATIKDTVDDIRDALTPMVAASPQSLSRRIGIYRNWYPFIWIASSVLLVVVYLVFASFTPACTSPPTPGQICH